MEGDKLRDALLPNPDPDGKEAKVTWPILRESDELERVGSAAIHVIEELEECWEREVLPLVMKSSDPVGALGSTLASYYEGMTLRPEEPLRSLRRRWVEIALDDFRVICTRPNVTFRALRTDDRGNLVVDFQNQEVLVRRDQVLDLRHWSIGIRPVDELVATTWATQLLKAALTRLASDFSCIGRMGKAQASGRLPGASAIRWGGRTSGIRFERLVLNILNEDDHCASKAKLWEDLFEWTDLRVRYPDLDRRNGARIQVTLMDNELLESQKVARQSFSSAYVVLSPVRLAKYVEHCVEVERTDLVGSEFWNCLPRQPSDTSELAFALKEVFASAIANTTPHPLGRIPFIPRPVRELTRNYVRDEALGANRRMRDLLNVSRGYPGWKKMR